MLNRVAPAGILVLGVAGCLNLNAYRPQYEGPERPPDQVATLDLCPTGWGVNAATDAILKLDDGDVAWGGLGSTSRICGSYRYVTFLPGEHSITVAYDVLTVCRANAVPRVTIVGCAGRTFEDELVQSADSLVAVLSFSLEAGKHYEFWQDIGSEDPPGQVTLLGTGIQDVGGDRFERLRVRDIDERGQWARSLAIWVNESDDSPVVKIERSGVFLEHSVYLSKTEFDERASQAFGRALASVSHPLIVEVIRD